MLNLSEAAREFGAIEVCNLACRKVRPAFSDQDLYRRLQDRPRRTSPRILSWSERTCHGRRCHHRIDEARRYGARTG